MLDTMKLSLKDYSVSQDNKLTVQPASYMARTGEVINEFPLFRDKGGRAFHGSKAFLNTEQLNLTLAPFTRSETGVSCFVQFSVPKVASGNGNNYYPVDEQGSLQVVERVELELREAGINTALQEADISRMDAFRNIEPDEPFSAYYNLFPLLKARRTIQRGYGTTFLAHNSQQEYAVYDKNEEMRRRGVDLADFPERTMRFEHRLLNTRKIAAVHGFSKVGSLFSGGFEHVKDVERESWRRALFSHSVGEVQVLGAAEIETELRYYREHYGRNFFQRFLVAYGARHLAQIAGIEMVKLALQGLEMERTKIWRAEKLLEEVKRELEFLKRGEGSQKTLGELYGELRQKVLQDGS